MDEFWITCEDEVDRFWRAGQSWDENVEWAIEEKVDWNLEDWTRWEECRDWSMADEDDYWNHYNWEMWSLEQWWRYHDEPREPTACIWTDDGWICKYSWCQFEPEQWPPGVENSPDFYGCEQYEYGFDEDDWLCNDWGIGCEREEPECDYFCEWEQSELFRNCEYTFDADRALCWEQMEEETGCDAELVCDFEVCNPEE